MMTPNAEESNSLPGPAPEEKISDRSLLRRFQHGRSDASTELYLRYAERLMAVAASQSSATWPAGSSPEDIVQSVFRTFFPEGEAGPVQRPRGEELWKLLLVIALNKVRADGLFHRAAKRDVRRTSGGESFDRALESEPGRDEAA